MKRNLGIVTTAIVMAAALTACSGNNASTGTTAAPATADATETAAGSDAGESTAEDSDGSAEPVDYSWPTKNLQLICPFAAGGDSDANARWIASYLTEEMGMDVVVVNMDGNGGAVGARAAKDSANDGSVALCSSSAFITNELSGAIDFGLDEFEFSCIFAENPGNIVCVNKDLGVNTFQELIDYSKANPGKLKMAYNSGATTHAIALQIQDAGVDATLVDAGASSDRIAALLGGHVDIIINAYGSVKDYLESGQFIGLGLTGESSAENIPGYTSLKEQGFDVVFPTYFFLAFPKGTDPALAEKLSAAAKNVVLNNPNYAEDIKNGYQQSPTYYDGEEGKQKLLDSREEIIKYTAAFQGKE